MKSRPQKGDVIVHQRGNSRAVQFDVGLFDRPQQYSVRTYEDALNRADSFARNNDADVWFTENGTHFRLVTTRRRPAN